MKTYNNFLLIFLFLVTIACDKKETKSVLADYNIVWNSQSENASESMPLVGGDIGCNVWVENGDVLLYVQRSGSLNENGEYYLQTGSVYGPHCQMSWRQKSSQSSGATV